MDWNAVLSWVEARASEKSTWVGLIGLVASATGHAISPDTAPQIDMIAGAIVAAVAIIIKEKK